MTMSIEIYPVVHINERVQALGQTALALEKGADGVFLIDHFSPDESTLLKTYDEAADKFPLSFIGINMLRAQSSLEAFSTVIKAKNNGSIGRYPSGLWVDNAISKLHETHYFRIRSKLATIRYLGGVAFKYTPYYIDEPEVAAAEAAWTERYVDVVTTSGPETGKPPNPDKIAAMKQALERKPLAVASGIDAGNLEQYAEWVDQVLVASSIETYSGSGVFDEAKLADLIEMAHELEKSDV